MQAEQLNIIVTYAPRDWDLDFLMDYFWYVCNLTNKVSIILFEFKTVRA